MSEPVTHGWKMTLGQKALAAGGILMLLSLGLCAGTGVPVLAKVSSTFFGLGIVSLLLGGLLLCAGICILIVEAISRRTAIEVPATDASGGVVVRAKKKLIGPMVLVGSIVVFILGILLLGMSALSNGNGMHTAVTMILVGPVGTVVGLVMTIRDFVAKRKSREKIHG